MKIGRFAAVVGHQHHLRLVFVEHAAKLVEQAFADAEILCLDVRLRVGEASEEVGWRKLILVAHDDDLLTEGHGQKAVEHADL